jgi:hypothetical protein
MDILFSPYGLGGMPKSAVAEVERRTEELLRSSSFQRMLELEKKHKVRVNQPRLRTHLLACWLGPCLDCYQHVLHFDMSLTLRSQPQTDGALARHSNASPFAPAIWSSPTA